MCASRSDSGSSRASAFVIHRRGPVGTRLERESRSRGRRLPGGGVLSWDRVGGQAGRMLADPKGPFEELAGLGARRCRARHEARQLRGGVGSILGFAGTHPVEDREGIAVEPGGVPGAPLAATDVAEVAHRARGGDGLRPAAVLARLADPLSPRGVLLAGLRGPLDQLSGAFYRQHDPAGVGRGHETHEPHTHDQGRQGGGGGGAACDGLARVVQAPREGAALARQVGRLRPGAHCRSRAAARGRAPRQGEGDHQHDTERPLRPSRAFHRESSLVAGVSGASHGLYRGRKGASIQELEIMTVSGGVAVATRSMPQRNWGKRRQSVRDPMDPPGGVETRRWVGPGGWT